VTSASVRTYVLTVAGALVGLERVFGLLRRRRVTVLWLSVQSGERVDHSRLLLRVKSANHDQVRRQLARLIEVTTQTDLEESRDDAA
jgi:acetolactate synthase small subunit